MTERPALAGKVMIVTGGSSGIGAAIVTEAAAQGASVVIDHVGGADAADRLAADLQTAPGETAVFRADVSRTDELRALIDFAVERFGRLDVMINNAGIESGETLQTLTEEKYDLLMSVNLKGAVFGAKLAAEQMRRQGDGGVIINITSTHEDWPMPSDLSYCISKGGMRMLTRTAGVELGPDGIRMVGVGPGAIDTPINAGMTEEQREALRQAIPLGRIAAPDEIADVVCFVASDAARYLTATTVMADGGLMQKPGAT